MNKDSGDDFGQSGPRRRRRIPEPAPRAPRPIDAAQLQELAIGYAARYATTAAKLRRYLQRKLHERDWTPAEAPDVEGLIGRITALGYVDDRAYAAAKQRDLTARGFGVGRVRQALAAAGVSREDAGAAIAPEDGGPGDAYAPAIAFARRRRFGPFGRHGDAVDAGQRQDRLRRELAAMARAGHGFDVSRRVLTAADEAALAQLSQD
jgi:regulatory protein